MRMLALLLLLAYAPRALAEDAPLVVQPGDPAPFAGVLVPEPLAVRRAQELAACRVEVPELRKLVLAAPSPAQQVLTHVLMQAQ